MFSRSSLSSVFPLGYLPCSDGMAHCFPDHFLGAASPALVEPRVADQNREIVAAPVMTRLRTGWALRHIVPPDLPDFSNVLQDVEHGRVPATLTSLSLPWRLRRRHKICRHGLSRNEPMEFRFRDAP